MSKIYSQKDVAEKIAAKLSKKGTPHQVIEAEGGFKVVTEAQLEQMTAPAGEVPSFTEEQPAASTNAKKGDELVTITVAGAKITKEYVITPTLGKRPRWFEKKRIHSAEYTPDKKAVVLVLARKALSSRGLKKEADEAQLAA